MSQPVSRGRRASLPGASELFRGSDVAKPTKQAAEKSAETADGLPAPSGRVKHDQKITVYFSSDELFALEEATLDVRRRLGRSLDRGRLVRTAVALVLQDLKINGDEAAVMKALLED